MFGKARKALIVGQRDGKRLQIVVAQHEFRYRICHRGEQRVAILACQPVLTHRIGKRDLDVDLDVRRIHAGRIVDRIRIAAPTIGSIGDATLLGDAQICALPDHLGLHLVGGHADHVIGAVAHFRIRFAGSLDVGADSAEPEKIDLHAKNGRHDLLRRCTPRLHADGLCRFLRQFHRFQRARDDHAARRHLLLVVVLPARARQVEEPFAFGESGFEIRIRIDEDVAVIIGGHKPDLLRQQHAVAEHVARHVTDTGDCEGFALDVDIHLAEVALDRFPGTPRGDAHLLVVIAGRPAGGKGVIKPEVLLLADRIRRIRECRRALVGGHHEIGIVAIVANSIGGRQNRVAVEIVGDRQKRADEELVSVTPGLENRLATAIHRQALGIEPALGADRHDHGILDLLCFHKTQNLGAVILGAVRPAQTTARNGTEAQMNAFDRSAINEDLAEGSRLGQRFERARVELESEIGPRMSVLVTLEIVCPERRGDRIGEAADDPVIVLARHLGEVLLDRGRDPLKRLLTRHVAQIGIETGPEQIEEFDGDFRITRQRVGDVVLRVVKPSLAQIAGDGAQHHRFTRTQSCAHHQPVEAVIVDLAAPDGEKGFLQPLGILVQREMQPVGAHDLHVVQQNRAFGIGRVTDRQFVRLLGNHPETEIFEQRHAAGQRQRRIRMKNLETEMILVVFVLPVERDPQSVLGFERPLDIGDVGHRRTRIEALLVGLADIDAVGILTADGQEFVFPTRNDGLDVALELVMRNLGRLALVATDDEMDARHAAFRKGGIVCR